MRKNQMDSTWKDQTSRSLSLSVMEVNSTYRKVRTNFGTEVLQERCTLLKKNASILTPNFFSWKCIPFWLDVKTFLKNCAQRVLFFFFLRIGDKNVIFWDIFRCQVQQKGWFYGCEGREREIWDLIYQRSLCGLARVPKKAHFSDLGKVAEVRPTKPK